MLNERVAAFASPRAMSRIILLTLFCACVLLHGCGGSGGPSAASAPGIPGPDNSGGFTLGGSIAGLNAGSTVVLNSGSETITADANGRFSFSTAIPSNGSYQVTIGTQPQGQVCTVFNGSGSAVAAPVTNVIITCLNSSHDLSGRISGLASGAAVVLVNDGDVLTLTDNGTFFFPPIATNSSYSITVQAQPDNQICTVSNGSGAGVVADVSDIRITCSYETYTVSGSVSGLLPGAEVVLENNDADPLAIARDGSFTFSTPIARNGSYRVTVADQPDGATCTVTNGSGAGATLDVANVMVVCSTNTYAVSGTVAGLAVGAQVTLTLRTTLTIEPCKHYV